MHVSRASPLVLHILFVNDNMLFCKVGPRECDEVMKALGTYGKAYGQRINFEKSSLLFGKKIPGHVKKAYKTSTRIANDFGVDSYLCILEDISVSKTKTIIAFLKERLQNRVNGYI